MGNPRLEHSVVPQVGPAPPADQPEGILGVRCCALCALCLELGQYARTSGWAECAWQGRWEFPEDGCIRWSFAVDMLGDEGAE